MADQPIIGKIEFAPTTNHTRSHEIVGGGHMPVHLLPTVDWQARALAAEAALLRLRQQVEVAITDWEKMATMRQRDGYEWGPAVDAYRECITDVRACLDTLGASK